MDGDSVVAELRRIRQAAECNSAIQAARHGRNQTGKHRIEHEDENEEEKTCAACDDLEDLRDSGEGPGGKMPPSTAGETPAATINTDKAGC